MRISWTLAFTVLGLMVFFIYIEYMSEFRARSKEFEAFAATSPGPRGEGKEKPIKAVAPPRPLPRRSRKYRMRR